LRPQAIFPTFAHPLIVPRHRFTAGAWATIAVTWLAARKGRLLRRATLGVAVLLLTVAGALLLLRSANAGRVYPAIYVAGQPLGGMTRGEAESALGSRASSVEDATVTLSYDGHRWSSTLRDLGVQADPDAALAAAYELGREPDALARLRTTAGLVRTDARLPLPLSLNHQSLDHWFDRIDGELGKPPKEAGLTINGTTVSISPEANGTVVDRVRATSDLLQALRQLRPLDEPLPTRSEPASVRASDLVAARDTLTRALSQSIQVTFGDASWTLAPGELGAFVTQRIDPKQRGAAAFSLSIDQTRLAGWLDDHLAPDINRAPKDAVVGWNQQLVAVEPSVDGAHLNPGPLARLVSESFFGGHAPVPAPVTITKPTIDSEHLDQLGIVALLGTGTSNYDGSTDGRATNVEVGASLLNGTLVPPHGEFSFDHSIGVINEEKGFVEAQVIDGERIGKDIGGGICQVSTTAFRAAYLAGLPIGEWNPHRFRIPFYELDGWPPGLDASILEPTDDPSTWGDFTFENPSDGWLLVESWSTGVNVVVNIYGPDLGYRVEDQGPTYGEKLQIEPDEEVVDPELDPGTINHTQLPQEGQEVSHNRIVYDRNGTVVEERNFYTRYYARGNVWTVSPDMAGKSPSDPGRPLPKPQPAQEESALAQQPIVDGSDAADAASGTDGSTTDQAPSSEDPSSSSNQS
jgi:vancomycin resistance protein YoaR